MVFLLTLLRIPLAGGQYNWYVLRAVLAYHRSFPDHRRRVAVLAPPSCSNFLSYLTGWITVIAWQVGTASSVYLCGSMIQGLVILNYPDYVPERWQATLMFYAVRHRPWYYFRGLNLRIADHYPIIVHQHIFCSCASTN